MIMLEIREFDQFIGEGLEAMIEGDKQKAKDQEKNLPNTASESQASQVAKPAGKLLPRMEKSPTAETV